MVSKFRGGRKEKCSDQARWHVVLRDASRTALA
jgi:hypothetical protein